ncbi:MAG: ATP-binding protein [Lentisphaeria bacterium]
MTLVAQSDYCIFLGGLALLGIAVTALLLNREDRETTLAWPWLAGFGFLQALYQWSKLAVVVFPATAPFLESGAQVVRISALVALLEFGRRAVPLWSAWRPGPWFAAPWLLVALASAWFVPEHASWTLRVFLFLPAAALGAAGLAAAAWRQRPGAAWLWPAAAGLAGLIVFTLPNMLGEGVQAVAGRPGAVWAMHTDWLLMVWIVCWSLMLVGLFGFWDWIRRQNAFQTGEWGIWLWLRWLVFVLLLPVLGAGWLITNTLGKREQQKQENNWITTVQLTATAVGAKLDATGLNENATAQPKADSLRLMQSKPMFRNLIIWFWRDGALHRLFDARRPAPGDGGRERRSDALLRNAWEQFQAGSATPVWLPLAPTERPDVVVLSPLRQPDGHLAGMVGIEVDGSWLATAPQTQRSFGILLSLLLVLIWLLWVFFPLSLAHRRRAMELRENADRFRRLFSKLDSSFFLLEPVPAAAGHSPSYRFAEVNPAFEELAGKPREALLGHRPEELFTNLDPDWLEIANRVMATGVSERLERFSPVFQRHLDIVVYRPFPNQLAVIFTDVTERKRLQQRLQDTQKMESLGLLAGGIAHDFNNLLMIILGNAELVRLEVKADTETSHALDEIKHSTLKAAELSKQMLIYAGRSFINPKPLAMNTVLEETLALIESSLPAQQGIHRQFDPRLPVIAADEGQTRQMIVNLVTNAVEALGDTPGGITVTTGVASLSAEQLADLQGGETLKPGDYLFLEVGDTGAGMDAETQLRMFDPFFSTKFTGRGLGLAAVLGIVRGHHGVIRVRSAKDHGTAITVYLPCPVPPLSLPAPAAALPTPAQARTTGATLLVTDDDPEARFVMCRHLALAGFKTLEAGDGNQAVAVFQEHRQHIAGVLLDLKMPNMNGEAAFAEIQRQAPGFPVLLVSGYSEDEAHRLFAGRPWAGFLQKPFTAAEMLAKVQAILVRAPETTAPPPRTD